MQIFFLFYFICRFYPLFTIFIHFYPPLIFCIMQMVICLQNLHVRYCIIQHLVKKRDMPIKSKHKKNVLIFLYELDSLFLAHLGKLLSVIC